MTCLGTLDVPFAHVIVGPMYESRVQVSTIPAAAAAAAAVDGDADNHDDDDVFRSA